MTRNEIYTIAYYFNESKNGLSGALIHFAPTQLSRCNWIHNQHLQEEFHPSRYQDLNQFLLFPLKMNG